MWICPECQSAPNVNVPKMSECAQNVRVHPMWMCPKCLCAQCTCAQNVRVRPMWICPKCQSARNVNPHTFFGWLFLCPNFQSAPKVNVPMLAHCLGGISTPNLSEWSHNVRVHPIWMHPKCQSVPDVNAPRMSECTQCECTQNVRVRPLAHIWCTFTSSTLSQCLSTHSLFMQ